MRRIKKHVALSDWGHQTEPREQEALDLLIEQLNEMFVCETDIISVSTEIQTKEREVFDEHRCKATAFFWSDS